MRKGRWQGSEVERWESSEVGRWEKFEVRGTGKVGG